MTLHEYIEQNRSISLRYGKSDCATFIGGWVKEQTGMDIVPAYKSKREGIEAMGGVSIGDYLASLFDEIAPAWATPGDLAVLPSDNDVDALGIVVGETIAALGPRHGLVFVDLLSASRAFRIA